MANAQNANSIYVDSTGALTTAKNSKLLKVFFTSALSDDELLLTDGGGGANKVYLRNSEEKQTQAYDFGPDGVVFPNGIYVATLTSNAKAVLMVRST